jgi:predicted RNase H-like nuclease (RuvC/YqgF family)
MNTNKRYMINTNTGVIMGYKPEVMAMGLAHVKECTADGVILGAANNEVDELRSQVAELQSVIDEKNRRIASLESYINTLEEERNAAPEVAMRRELEDMTLEDLKKVCAEKGIAAKGNKSDLIKAIMAADTNAADKE